LKKLAGEPGAQKSGAAGDDDVHGRVVILG
jgi:hypothetical protein